MIALSQRTLTLMYLISVTFFFLLLMFQAILPSNFSLLLFSILGLVLGMPHGALDYELSLNTQVFQSPIGQIIFWTGYLWLALGTWLLWQQFPTVAFIGFLLLSVWHFGEDWHFKTFSLVNSVIIGSLFIALPTFFYSQQVIKLFSYLIPNGAAYSIAENLRALCPLLLLAAVVLIIRWFKAKAWDVLLRFTAYLLSGLFLPPVYFLISYFCFYHSPKHFFSHLKQLSKQAKGELYWRLAFVLLVTLVFFLALLAVIEKQSLEPHLFASTLQLIACLTVPHMLFLFVRKGGTHPAQSL